MSRPPAAYLAAVAQVSERILCLSDCYCTLPVTWCAAHEQTEIRHPDSHCECVRHPDGPEAVALSQFTNEEISRFVAVAQYGEPLPVHVGVGAP